MMDIEQDSDKMLFSKRVESLRVSQPTYVIGHSQNCDILTSLLQFADSKRYNIPITQIRGKFVAFYVHPILINFYSKDCEHNVLS